MSGTPVFTYENEAVRVTLDLATYRLVAAQKAAYAVAAICTATFGSVEGQSLPVTFLFKPGTGESAALEAVRRFYEELLDQQLREEVADETRALRALILAQAFSKTDLIRRP